MSNVGNIYNLNFKALKRDYYLYKSEIQATIKNKNFIRSETVNLNDGEGKFKVPGSIKLDNIIITGLFLNFKKCIVFYILELINFIVFNLNLYDNNCTNKTIIIFGRATSISLLLLLGLT